MKNLNKLINKLRSKKAKIAVVGLGYVGLPLAIEKAKAGFQVVGIDRNIDRVNKVNKGICYIPDVVEEGMDRLVKSGKLKAVTGFKSLKNVDAVCICVPTPLKDDNKTQDISYIEYVTKEISKKGAVNKPGKHHLSRHDRRNSSPRASKERAQSREGFLPLLLSGKGGSRQ